jgi:hypothetical protein
MQLTTIQLRSNKHFPTSKNLDASKPKLVLTWKPGKNANFTHNDNKRTQCVLVTKSLKSELS